MLQPCYKTLEGGCYELHLYNLKVFDSVKLNGVVWKRVCQFSSPEASGSPHRVFNSVAARPEEEYHSKSIHRSSSLLH